MESLDYEIKFGKHIAFRHKDKKNLQELRLSEKIIPKKKSKKE